MTEELPTSSGQVLSKLGFDASQWRDIEAMVAAAGAEITEGAGSLVRIALNGVRAVFHRPHPQKETEKGAVKSLRRFLIEAGVIQCRNTKATLEKSNSMSKVWFSRRSYQYS